MLVQRLEYRKIGERAAARELELAKSDTERAVRVARLEAPEQGFEHRPLQRRDRRVIDQFGGPRRVDCRRWCERLRRGILGKAGHRGHIDVEKIEPGAA